MSGSDSDSGFSGPGRAGGMIPSGFGRQTVRFDPAVQIEGARRDASVSGDPDRRLCRQSLTSPIFSAAVIAAAERATAARL